MTSVTFQTQKQVYGALLYLHVFLFQHTEVSPRDAYTPTQRRSHIHTGTLAHSSDHPLLKPWSVRDPRRFGHRLFPPRSATLHTPSLLSSQAAWVAVYLYVSRGDTQVCVSKEKTHTQDHVYIDLELGLCVIPPPTPFESITYVFIFFGLIEMKLLGFKVEIKVGGVECFQRWQCSQHLCRADPLSTPPCASPRQGWVDGGVVLVPAQTSALTQTLGDGHLLNYLLLSEIKKKTFS